MSSSLKSLRTTAILVVSSWLVVHLLALFFPNVFVPWNAQAFDRLFQFRSESPSFQPTYDSTVIHVDFNDYSVSQLGADFPSRSQLGDVAEAVATFGASAQIWDFIFPEASDDPLADEAFLRGTESAANVYFGASLQLSTDPDARIEIPLHPERKEYLDSTAWQIRVEGDTKALLRAANARVTMPKLARASRGLGYLNLRFDRDGVFRRAPLVIRYNDAFYPSMPFRAICDYLAVTPDRIVVKPGESVTLLGARRPGVDPADIVIPVNEAAEMAVNFVGHWDRMKHFSFADILQMAGSSEDLEFFAEDYHTSGSLVVVSQVSTGASDIAPVPTDNNFPLSGLHANVMHTILTGQFLTEWGFGRMMLVEFVLVVLTVLVGSLRSFRLMGAGAIALLIGYFFACSLLFLAADIIANLIIPSLVLLLGFIAISTQRYFTEEKTKEVLKHSFESYFPPGVVRRIMANPNLITVGGQKKELTILFSDIKSFTHYSSTMAADTIQKMLNEYFEAMVDIVFKYEGTVDKFIGDGLMVFFGDPEPQEDHALRCVNAAVEMQRKCRQLKNEWVRKGLFELKIRVGVNTGMVVVGNMGSARRLSYTVLGAPVNMAQRLESNAPVEGIMISQRTWELVKDHVQTRPLEPVRVKGIDEPVTVYEVVVD